MNNPVNDKLTSRIREVFNDFEDPTADAGWQELRKKYPEHNRRPLILWLSSAAALLLLATGLWFVNRSEQTIAIKPAKEEKTFTGIEKPKSISEETAGKENLKQEINVDPSQEKKVYGNNIEKREHELSTNIQTDQAGNSANLIIPQDLNPQEQFPDEVLAVELPEDIQMSKSVSLVIKDQDDFRVRPINPKKPAYIGVFNPKPTETDAKEEKTEVKNQKLAFSVFAGSYFNYSEGSENQLNFGAGFISDIRLSRNLKLSTGLSIAANSLDYNTGQDLPQSASSSFDSAVKLSSGNLTTITSYHAKLLTLDIPVNIKYQFIPESDKFYISTGLSSGTYLNESYAYEYRNFNTSTGSYIAQTRDQKIEKQLSDFDLGRTLNLSFGISAPFGKGQTISIEPFLKYPLGGLGSEDLKFGSTGINLKLRFKPAKK